MNQEVKKYKVVIDQGGTKESAVFMFTGTHRQIAAKAREYASRHHMTIYRVYAGEVK